MSASENIVGWVFVYNPDGGGTVAVGLFPSGDAAVLWATKAGVLYRGTCLPVLGWPTV